MTQFCPLLESLFQGRGLDDLPRSFLIYPTYSQGRDRRLTVQINLHTLLRHVVGA